MENNEGCFHKRGCWKIDPNKSSWFILLRTFCGNFFNLLLQAISIHTTLLKVSCNNECYIFYINLLLYY